MHRGLDESEPADGASVDAESGSNETLGIDIRLARLLARCCPERQLLPDAPLREQGLPSLAAARLLLEINKELGLSLTIADLLGGLTLRDIEQRVRPVPSVQEASPAVIEGAIGIPLLPLQQAFLVTSIEGAVDDPVGCHIYREYSVKGYSAGAIANAWSRLCTIQPILSCVITAAGRYGPGPAPAVTVHEVDSGSHLAVLGQIRAAWSARRERQPDDLVRLAVVQSGDQSTLVLSADGLIIDAVGLACLVRQLSALLVAPETMPAEPQVTFEDAVAQLEGPGSGEDLSYWKERLADLPDTIFEPEVTARSATRSGASCHRRVFEHRLDPARWQACESYAASLGVTPTSLILGLFAKVLLQFEGRDSAAVMITSSRRAQLAQSYDDLIGSFTSNLLFSLKSVPGESHEDYFRRINDSLWHDASHGSVSAMAALRQAGRASEQGYARIAFTSLLGIDEPDPQTVLHETFQASQTSGVVIEHHMQLQDGGLFLQWTVVDDHLPPFAADLCFAWLVGIVECITADTKPGPPLHPLQQAYWLERSSGTREPGCNAVFSFVMEHNDLTLLETAWQELLAEHGCLRRIAGQDGLVSEAVAEQRHGPVVVIAAPQGDPGELRTQLDRQLGDLGFSLGLGPTAMCVAMRKADGQVSVHCAFDLMFLDGRTIHQIVNHLAAATAGLRPAADGNALFASPPGSRLSDYWQTRAKALTPGPVCAAGNPFWQRIEAKGAGFSRLAQRCSQAGIKPEELCAAVFAMAWQSELDRSFTIPMVWWGSSEPGENSVMSWHGFDARPEAGSPEDQAKAMIENAKAIAAERDRDLLHDPLSGMAHVARHIRQLPGAQSLPVVFTQTAVWSSLPEPLAGSLRWVTRTPGIALDAVSLVCNDVLRLGFDYREDCFPDGQVERVHARTMALLRPWLAAQDAGLLPVGEQAAPEDYLPPREWTHGPVTPINPVLVQDRFEVAAQRRSEAPAVLTAAGTLTFAELNRYANRIALHLRDLGVAEGDRVGIAVRRGSDMIAAVIGVLKAGAVYVPIDPAQPSARAARMLDLAEVGTVLTSATTELRFAVGSRKLVRVDAIPLHPAEGSNLRRSCTADALAYVIFTSGSTGEPKGVEVQHFAVQNLLDWGQRSFHLGEQDLGLCVTPLGFDLSVFDILGLLSFGAALYVADESELRDPAILYGVMVDRGVTFWNSAPKMFEQMQEIFLSAADRCTTLRLAFCSGDYMSVNFPQSFAEGFPGARLINLGGATEATVWSNCFEVQQADPEWRSVPYGRPIDNARYYVLDDRFKHCRPGIEGDLFIAGEVLARGYCNRPDLTAERFLPDPFAEQPGARMYATGDRAYFRDDGVIVFCGRRDGQVKIRGVRIEVEEIEHALRQHPSIAEAIVTTETDPSGETKLIAHVQATAPLPVGEIHEFAKSKLPLSMCPSRINLIDKVPMTTNGKADRKMLASLASGQSELPVAPSPTPATGSLDFDLGTEIGALIAGLLGHSIDPDADLWQQGVTSFTMVQLGNALRSKRGLSLKVEWLLEAPSVNGLAQALAQYLGLSADGRAALAAPPAATDRDANAPDLPSHAADNRIDLFDGAAKAAFLASAANLRCDLDQAESVPFLGEPVPDTWIARRMSARRFDAGPIELQDLRRLLAPLARHSAGSASPRYFYPSAGATYAVQVYLWVKEGGAAGLQAGYYWFNPIDSALRRIGAVTHWDVTSQFMYNRELFEASAAAILLVGESAGIAPLYGDNAERLQLLEAGYMAQLLMLAQGSTGLGLCPIGSFKEEQVREGLRLSASQQILHTLLIGQLPGDQMKPLPLPPLFAAPAAAEITLGKQFQPVPINIVGHSFRYAGAEDSEALFAMLASGASAVRSSAGRADSAMQGATWFGAFLDGADEFDPAPFGIAPSDARLIDPQGRILLELVLECLGQAGHDSASLERHGERTGVFVAQMWQDFRLAARDQDSEAPIAGAGSELANRISQVFGLTGPSLSVDSACTSSIAAIHLACQALEAGDCHSAIVCGVNLLTHASHLETLARLGFVTRHQPGGIYDSTAQGWAPGEGAGVVLLRRADATEAHADRVLARIEASHLEHSGPRSRYGVPNTETIAQGLRQVMAKAGCQPSDIAYVECAASGATLTDAAEWSALDEVFSAEVSIGSVKPNLGHLEAASGMSQLSKVLLQAERGMLLPTSVAPAPSPLLVRSDALQVNRFITPVPAGPITRYLINSVGSTSGAAQLILARHEVNPCELAKPSHDADAPLVLVLSAPSEEQLGRLAQDYVEALGRYDQSDWAAVCATSQLARKAYACRLAVPATSLHEARRLLAEARAAASGTRCDPARHGQESRAEEWRGALQDWLQGDHVDWMRFWDRHPGRRSLPVYALNRRPCGLVPGLARPADRAAAHSDHSEAWLDQTIQAFAQASGLAPDELDADRPLGDYGVSSRIAVQLIASLQLSNPGVRLSPTVLFEHPTLRGVAGEFARSAPEGAAPRPAEARNAARSLAILGYDGQFPGCDSVDALWHKLAEGADLIAEGGVPLPSGGRGRELLTGGFLDPAEVKGFDPLLFGITPKAAALMDPQERLLLMRTWRALEHAGYPPHRLRTELQSRVGVYVGSMHNEYPLVGLDCTTDDTWRDAGGTPAGLANRLSYHFDLKGPSLTIDSMCSSSLTALKLAADSLRAGDIDLAIVAAANLSLHPNKFAQQRRMGMTSPSGRCRSFAADADGFVPGEGVIAIVLRRMADAEACGDPVRAVLRGVAINHGGRSNGYTVPNPEAQAAIIEAALADGGVRADTVSYVEAHGTGTVLGDPIEARGIIKALALEQGQQRLAVGSLKSNLGHLEAAAGLAGLVKIAEQLRRRMLVPSIHAGQLNPEVDWNRLELVTRLQTWEPRFDSGHKVWRAGISSFGAGGSNAHAVLEAWDSPVQRSSATHSAARSQLLVLSAATPAALHDSAKALLAWWESEAGQAFALRDICATLQIAREPLPERWGAVVTDAGEARRLLTALVAGEQPGKRGRASSGAGAASAEANLDLCLQGWVAGQAVAWGSFHGDGWSLVDLPGYPFQCIPCWIDQQTPGLPLAASAPAPVLGESGAVPTANEAMQLLERVWRPLPANRAQPVAAGPRRIALFGAEQERQILESELSKLRPADTVLDAAAAEQADCLVFLPSAQNAAISWHGLFQHTAKRLRSSGAAAVRLIQIAGLDLAADAKLAGMLACLAAEQAGASHVWIEPGPDGGGPARIAAMINTALDGTQSAAFSVSDLGYLAPHWQPLAAEPKAWQPDPAASYLISGGVRGLGAKLARELVRLGVRQLVLLGSRKSAESEALERELHEAGAQVRCGFGDIGDPATMAQIAEPLLAGWPGLGGIFHCAGRNSAARGRLAECDPAAAALAIGPKVDGLAALAALARRHTPAFVVAFSSLSGSVPQLGFGVGDYAAANLAMDVLAERLRRSTGLAVTTVAWPIWASSTADEAARATLARHGLTELSDAEAFAHLWQALGTPSSGRLAIATGRLLLPPSSHEKHPPLRSEAPVPGLADDQTGKVGAAIRLAISRITGLQPEAIHEEADFASLGIESIALGQLTDLLSAELALDLNPATLLEFPSLSGLAKALGPAVAAASAPVPAMTSSTAEAVASVPQPETQTVRRDARIAVIGIGLRLPGAETVAEFARLLSRGNCAIGDVPSTRWDIAELYDRQGQSDKSISRWGGFLSDLEYFDPDQFGIDEATAAHLDPSIRLILEAGDACLRDSGYERGELDRQTGVFIGSRMGDYRLRSTGAQAVAGLGHDQNFIAAYLAQVLDLRGPNLVVDTACSSALVAVHLACQSLASGEVTLALAGAADILLDEAVYVQFTRAGALSPSGKCRTFSRQADGFVPGEGAVVFLLKRLDAALADGDGIHAVIEGSAVNNDGTTMGLTTPNPDAHRAVILAALAKAGRGADEIGLVEAHGTATRIGDPIEFRAFSQAFRSQTERNGYCAIGSVKSNLGHLMSAAGAAGLAKIILSVEKAIIPPTLFCEDPDPRLNLADSPFFIPDDSARWRAGAERVAGVSAAGLGGTNAHVIVAQAPEHLPRRHRQEPASLNKRKFWLDRKGLSQSGPSSSPQIKKSLLEIKILN